MKIGEIAKAAGVSTSRIRFYERKGIIPPGARGSNGYRDYSADMVAVLRFIEQAQGLGFTLPASGTVIVNAPASLIDDVISISAGGSAANNSQRIWRSALAVRCRSVSESGSRGLGGSG